jgi:hypothetical protein
MRQVEEKSAPEAAGMAKKPQKRYPVPGHPKSPLTMEEINKLLGYPVQAIGEEECGAVEKKYKGKTYRVPMLFPKREVEGSFLRIGVFERLFVRLESGTSIDRYTFVGYDSVSYLIRTYHHVLEDEAILAYSEVECAKHLGRPLVHNEVLERKLRQKVIK